MTAEHECRQWDADSVTIHDEIAHASLSYAEGSQDATLKLNRLDIVTGIIANERGRMIEVGGSNQAPSSSLFVFHGFAIAVGLKRFVNKWLPLLPREDCPLGMPIPGQSRYGKDPFDYSTMLGNGKLRR